MWKNILKLTVGLLNSKVYGVSRTFGKVDMMKIKIVFTIKVIIVLLMLTSCGIEETVKYSGRSYVGPTTDTVKEFTQKYGQVEPIGDEVNGMEVMLSEEEQKIIEDQNTAPTLLFLKKNDKEYVVYSLQGGP